jgi:cytochrome P450
MTAGEIRDQLFTMLIAGHETTAVSLAWAVYWMLREPASLARLRAELAQNEGAPPETTLRLPYLSAFVRETLRIEPVVTDVPRICRKPFELGSWTVPAGELVTVNIAALHADPAIYPEPERFRPERFLERKFHAGEFVPFGGGHRRCLGAAFAEAELAVAVSTIARDWDLMLADREPERSVRRNVTMGPARGVRVKVARRRAPSVATA